MPHKRHYSQFNQLLNITLLRWLILLNSLDNRNQPNPKCQKIILCCHAYLLSKGILTFFPFPIFELRSRLGSTNPWLIIIVKEPLPFQRQCFSHCSDLTTTRIFITMRSTPSLEEISAHTVRLSTVIFITYSIGNQFSPVHFQGLLSWQVSCYALFKGWLLLSQPPRCLWQKTLFTRSHLIGILGP